MENYYCLELKFKNINVSDKTYHAHLYIEDNEISIRIYHDSLDLDRKFMNFYNFEKLDEVINLSIYSKEKVLKKINVINSIGKKITSTQNENGKSYFTIFLDEIIIEKKQKNSTKEFANVYLNDDGFDLVKEMYSLFWKHQSKDIFDIKRMSNFEIFYFINKIKYRPEFKFSYQSSRNEKNFTIEKVPIIKFYTLKNTSIDDLIRYSNICCNFYSFYLGNHIDYMRINFLKKDTIISYIKSSIKNSNLKINSIQNILKKPIEDFFNSNWEENYIKNEIKLNKAIKAHINSFYVDYEAKFLLLFNILEILKSEITEVIEFDFKNKKNINSILKESLLKIKQELDTEFHVDFEKKWHGLMSNINKKPMKKIINEYLKINNIDGEIDIEKLYYLRNNIIHGSISNVDIKEIENINSVLYNVTEKLILNILGLKHLWYNEN